MPHTSALCGALCPHCDTLHCQLLVVVRPTTSPVLSVLRSAEKACVAGDILPARFSTNYAVKNKYAVFN
jgi:hypothetical protein